MPVGNLLHLLEWYRCNKVIFDSKYDEFLGDKERR